MNSQLEKLYSLGVPHNTFSITLPDGTYYPDHLLAGDKRPEEFLEHFDRVRQKDWSECTFLDLGCSEGSTTLGISQMGSTVYGVEGRADAVTRARVLGEILGYEKTIFSVGNVIDANIYREVDGIFCSGILYHLSDPVACLELCVKFARDFIYIDTGHMPRSDQEKKQSKFFAGFGKEYTIKTHGLKIKAINFAEPENTNEYQGEIRRGPRSGIGNQVSVWLLHSDFVRLMERLGFPYHVTIADKPHIPRCRTCFFRRQPRARQKRGKFMRPLPVGRPLVDARRHSCARDIAFLQKSGQPVTVLGRQPLADEVARYLIDQNISVQRLCEIPWNSDEHVHAPQLLALLKDPPRYVALAIEEPHRLYTKLNMLTRIEYIFTSFPAVIGSK